MRTLATVLAIAVLCLLFGELAGCGTADTDSPLVVLPRDVNGMIVTPTPTPTPPVTQPPPPTPPPTPTPTPTPPPAGAPLFGQGVSRTLFLGCPGDLAADGTTVPNYNCSDFLCQRQSQNFFTSLSARLAFRGDCHGLDANHDGIACNNLNVTCPAGCATCQ